MKKAWFFLMALIHFCACTSKEEEEPTGGPCAYKTTKIPATVIEIQTSDSLQFNIFFALPADAPVANDTITYLEQKGSLMSVQEFSRLHLKTGDVFNYERSEITSGHCTPHLEALRMEPYTNN